MSPEDGKRFRDLIRGMGRMFGAEPDALVLDAYWLALRDWDYAELEAAAAHLMRTAKFMPRPADFRELRKAGEQSAAEAWMLVLQNVRRSEYRRGVTVGGLADLAVKGMGGYEALGKRNPEKLNEFGAREFRERWDEAADREEIRAAMPSLARPVAGLALRYASGPQPVGALLDRLVKPR